MARPTSDIVGHVAVIVVADVNPIGRRGVTVAVPRTGSVGPEEGGKVDRL